MVRERVRVGVTNIVSFVDAEPPGPEHVSVYVVFDVGETD
jgi:hypothetical protein